MSRGYQGAMMRAFGAGEWVLTVLSTEDVTEHYRRIVVHAPGMFDGTPYGPASYIRLWAPDPEDPAKEYQRGYTIASCDEASEQMTLEFVMHEPAGPACRWAADAQPGDGIAATRWGAPRFVPPSPARPATCSSATSPRCRASTASCPCCPTTCRSRSTSSTSTTTTGRCRWSSATAWT
ncbi:siderophore-interacting protein [Nocardioides humi]|uniref:siderophore-interacting protein n=1 Tax=Nocardioides humi TaxID=449461 RepID=UPI0015E874A8|nr:siderophore-interacting protein [Nocardioides humi]